jgi:putative addiction module killer protein
VGQEIEILLYRQGGSCPFSEWISSLKDARAVGIVRARLNRIRLGNFGDSKPVGEGVEELRIDFGPGYRVYLGRLGSLVVILLCGGSKKSQAKDIMNAKKYWKECLNAKSSSKY